MRVWRMGRKNSWGSRIPAREGLVVALVGSNLLFPSSPISQAPKVPEALFDILANLAFRTFHSVRP